MSASIHPCAATRAVTYLLSVCVALQLAGCAQLAATMAGRGDSRDAVIERVASNVAFVLRNGGIVLLGEVHDNAALHRERLLVVEAALREGARPVFVFEQFDQESQPAIDVARRERPRDANHLIATAVPEQSGWNWDHYRPLIQLALDYELTIVAGNLSRGDAMKFAQGMPAAGALTLPESIPAAVREAQMREVRGGHCNLLPDAALAPMAQAQIARDATMARLIAAAHKHAAPGILGKPGTLVFAGNGHVRRDVGVPVWLARGPSSVADRQLIVGFLETGAPGAIDAGNDARYDRVVYGPPAERPDPCVALKARFAK